MMPAADASGKSERDLSAAARGPRYPVSHIAARRPWYDLGIVELLRAHELLFAFVGRLIAVQYKQTILGVGWAVVNPLINTAVFTLIFGKLAAIPSEGLPYPLFVLSGLVMWQYFSRAVNVGTNSVLANSHIITKVYFPRMILPLSSVLSGLVDVLINLLFLSALMIFYGRYPGIQALSLPVFIFLAMVLAFSLSLWLAPLNALYHDVAYVVPLVLQVWMFLTPVVYPAAIVPSGWAWLVSLNPVAVFIQGARWAVLPEAAPPDLFGLVACICEIVLLFGGGIVVFHKIDAVVADRI